MTGVQSSGKSTVGRLLAERLRTARATAVLVTGVQSSGKSTVGRLLAERLGRAAFIEGDDLWLMVVSGREDMADTPSDTALAQLELRYGRFEARQGGGRRRAATARRRGSRPSDGSSPSGSGARPSSKATTSGRWWSQGARTWPTTERAALEQLELRYRHGAMLSQSFVEAGLHAVHVDNVYGPAVIDQLDRVTCRRALVVLRPSVETVAEREIERGTDAYEAWRAGGSLVEAVRRFDGWLAETPPVGLWVDSTHQSAEQTVDWILEHWEQAGVS